MRITKLNDIHPPTVIMTGRFDAHEVGAFRAVVDPITEGSGTNVHLDLNGVNFIDSTGLAELVRAMKRCRSDGAELVLDTVSEPVSVILELTKLDRAFTFAAGAGASNGADA